VPGSIRGANTYSVRRIRKHGVSTSFELLEPSYGTHLTAKLEKGGAATYTISDWRTGAVSGWLCCNVKGDTFVLYENVATSADEAFMEPAATLAFAWKLSPDHSRRVDVVRLPPESYCKDAPPTESSVPDITEFSTPEGLQAALPPSGPRPPPAKGSLLQRRQMSGLAVDVTSQGGEAAGVQSGDAAKQQQPTSASGKPPLSVKSKWSPRIPSFSHSKSMQQMETPVQAGPSSLQQQLLSSPRASECGSEDIRAVFDIAEDRRPQSAMHHMLGGLKRSLSSKSMGERFLPGQTRALSEPASSPVSVLSTSGLPSPVSPGEASTSSWRIPMLSPNRKLPSLTSGLGGKELVTTLQSMMEQGVEETDLPERATIFRSAQPKWDPKTKSHSLLFGGLVHTKSVKNMVLLSFEKGGLEVAHPEYKTLSGVRHRRVTDPGLLSPQNGIANTSVLRDSLLYDEQTYNDETGRRTFLVGRHNSKDGSEFVCSHDPAALSKVQAFAMAIASCMKKAVYTYI